MKNKNLSLFLILLFIFLLLLLMINIKIIEKFADAQSPSQEAILSKIPIMILFYKPVNLNQQFKNKKDEDYAKDIDKKNKQYTENFDAASKKTQIKFYKFDVNDPQVQQDWTQRLPIEMNNGPVIRFYKNPGAGMDKDGMETLDVYKSDDILDFLKKK